MGQVKTSLSAGEMIRALLLDDKSVCARVNKIIPVDTATATLPYIVYRRASLEARPQKSGRPGADVVQMEISCYAESYTESVEIAEAVRACLDNLVSAEDNGYRLNGCYLADAEEGFESDAYVQRLIFNIKI